jgi:LysR family transcriptional regulator, hydrogen peroxide-inducible genes activator
MNTRDFEYLIALSEHHHFGKAAEACFVSQPALSMQIQRLEASLGVKLLERNNKSVLLTDVGFAITERAKQILVQINEIRDLAKLNKDPYSGALTLGVIPTLGPYLLPLILPALSKKFPNIHFYLVEEQTAVLIQKLKMGSLDAALMAHPIEESSFSCADLFAEEFLVAVANKHRLAQQKTIGASDLERQNLLLLEEGHCMRGQTLDLCHKMNVNQVQNFRATSLETLRQMVATGNSVTLMPKLAQQAHDGISYIPFNAPQPARSIGLFWRSSSVKTVVLADLVDQIRIIIAKKGLKIPKAVLS